MAALVVWNVGLELEQKGQLGVRHGREQEVSVVLTLTLGEEEMLPYIYISDTHMF